MYNSEKNTNHLTIRGGWVGGSTLTVSLTVRYPFFLTTSLTKPHLHIIKSHPDVLTFQLTKPRNDNLLNNSCAVIV